MKRFAFRLENVLRIRAFDLERARIALAHVERERRRRLAIVETTARQLAEGRAWLEAEIKQGADAGRIAMRADGNLSGRFVLGKSERALAELEPALVEARRRVQQTRARLRSLERLREQAEDRHRRAGFAAEQSEIEELAIGRVALERAAMRRAHEETSR